MGSSPQTSSVAALPTKALALNELDQRQIDKIRVRNERFTNKLIHEQSKKQNFQTALISRQAKHDKTKENLENKELDRKDFVYYA